MTDSDKPGFVGKTPREKLDLNIENANLRRENEEMRRRAAEAEDRLRNKPAAQIPTAAPQHAVQHKGSVTPLVNWEFGRALKFTFWGGLAGLIGYTGSKFLPASFHYFKAGPAWISRRVGGGLLGGVSALALGAAQVLGIGIAASPAYNSVMEMTSSDTTSKTWTARFGVAGFGFAQLAGAFSDSEDPMNVHHTFFDNLTIRTINGAVEVTKAGGEQLAKLDDAPAATENPNALLRNRFVHVCTPLTLDSKGNRHPEAQKAIDNGSMNVHFNEIDGIVDGMKNDPESTLNKTLKRAGNHAQLIVSAFDQAKKTVRVNPVSDTANLKCPDETYRSAGYQADEWMAKPGLSPEKVYPKF